MPQRIHSRFDLPPKCRVYCSAEEGLTQQQFKEECDVNVIVARYLKTGSWTTGVGIATRVPEFGDFSRVPDFREVMERVVSAQAEFDALPAKIRNRFHNDPQALLEFVSDEGNRDEAERLGLLAKKAEPVRVEAPPAVSGQGAADAAKGTQST